MFEDSESQRGQKIGGNSESNRQNKLSLRTKKLKTREQEHQSFVELRWKGRHTIKAPEKKSGQMPLR